MGSYAKTTFYRRINACRDPRLTFQDRPGAVFAATIYYISGATILLHRDCLLIHFNAFLSQEVLTNTHTKDTLGPHCSILSTHDLLSFRHLLLYIIP